MVGPASPGVDVLGAVGEEEEHSCPGDLFEEVFEDLLGALVDPVEVFDSQEHGAKLRTFEDDADEGLEDAVLSRLGLMEIWSMPLSFTERSSRR